MDIVFRLAQSGDRLGRPFQILLNAGIEIAAEYLRRNPLPSLYGSHVKYHPEPWAGDGVEEFANPLLVWRRGWADCDDAVIFRGGELLAYQGVRSHARVLREIETNRYHTQLSKDDGSLIIEDPCLQLLGRPYLFRRLVR